MMLNCQGMCSNDIKMNQFFSSKNERVHPKHYVKLYNIYFTLQKIFNNQILKTYDKS